MQNAHRFELPVPANGFFDFAGIDSPPEVGKRLRSFAGQVASSLPSDSCVVSLYVGGKGRFLGVPFTDFLKQQIDDPGRVIEQGRDGAVNLSGSLIMEIPGALKFKAQDEVIDEDNRKAISRRVFTPDRQEEDWRMIGLKQYFRDRTAEAVAIAREQGRTSVDYLLVDDRSVSRLTEAMVEDFMAEAIEKQHTGAFGKPMPIRVRKCLNLAINWEHNPGPVIRQIVEQTLGTDKLVNALGIPGVTLGESERDTSLSFGLRRLLERQGLTLSETRAVSHWAIYREADVCSYVVRGGFAGQDENGRALIVQQPAPGHVLKFAFDHLGRPMRPLVVDAKLAVEAYNREFAQGLLG